MGGNLSDISYVQGSRLRCSGLANVAIALARAFPSCLEAGDTAPQFEVWHEPYLQPGLAAETPDGTDSVEIRWPTDRRAGPTTAGNRNAHAPPSGASTG